MAWIDDLYSRITAFKNVISNKFNTLYALILTKQDTLTPGSNIDITGTTISAIDTTYTFTVGLGLAILKVGQNVEYSIAQPTMDKINNGQTAYTQLGNKANIDGSNTIGGQWNIDGAYSPILTTPIKQVFQTASDLIYFGNPTINTLYFESVGSMNHIQNGNLGLIWTQHNFDPNIKANIDGSNISPTTWNNLTAGNSLRWGGELFASTGNTDITRVMTYNGTSGRWEWNAKTEFLDWLGITSNVLNPTLNTVVTNGNTAYGDIVLNDGKLATPGLTIHTNEGGYIKAINNPGGQSYVIASGWEHKWYNEIWRVGNKRDNSAGTIGYVFEYNDVQKVVIGTDSNIMTENFGSANLWYQGYLNSQNVNNKVDRTGDTMSGMLNFSNNVGGIQGTIGDDDFWRIIGRSNSYNTGYLEIATADDGTEPIYVRQYMGVFGSVVRTLTLLDENGNTTIPGTIYTNNHGNSGDWWDTTVRSFKDDFNGGINNGSNTRRNMSWFDYDIMGAGRAAGVIASFDGLGSDYRLEIGGRYNGAGEVFLIRTMNGDTSTWNPTRELIHDGNVNTYINNALGGNYLRGSNHPTIVHNFNIAIGSDGARNFIQSHNSFSLDLNPLGNPVTIHGSDISGTTIANWNYAFNNKVWAVSDSEGDGPINLDNIQKQSYLGCFNDNGGDWWSTMNIQHRNGRGNDGHLWGTQFRVGMVGNRELLQFRGLANGVYDPWKTIWHNGNLNPANFATTTQLGNYVNKAGDTLNGGGRITSTAELFIQQASTYNATGLFWETMNNANVLAGIGSLTTGDTLHHSYMGWGTSPWDLVNNFAVSVNYIKWKDQDLWHTGNLNPNNFASFNNTITINGNTQVLGNNPNFTISMGGGGTTTTGLGELLDTRWQSYSSDQFGIIAVACRDIDYFKAPSVDNFLARNGVIQGDLTGVGLQSSNVTVEGAVKIEPSTYQDLQNNGIDGSGWYLCITGTQMNVDVQWMHTSQVLSYKFEAGTAVVIVGYLVEYQGEIYIDLTKDAI